MTSTELASGTSTVDSADFNSVLGNVHAPRSIENRVRSTKVEVMEWAVSDQPCGGRIIFHDLEKINY